MGRCRSAAAERHPGTCRQSRPQLPELQSASDADHGARLAASADGYRDRPDHPWAAFPDAGRWKIGLPRSGITGRGGVVAAGRAGAV